jgi:transposase, IS5 family
VDVLTISAPGAESRWDELLPVEARALPDDLAGIDELLGDPGLRPIAGRWERSAWERGRPTIAMETYVRLIVVKQRSGWGYETGGVGLAASRRFCLIPLSARVPDESTIRKLTRRLGPETVAELTRALIEKAKRERRFRPWAARIESTVVEADIKYPTDAELTLQGARALAREGRRSGRAARGGDAGAGPLALESAGRSGRSAHSQAQIGLAKAEVMRLNERADRLIRRSISEARRLAADARRAVRRRGARAKLRAARRLEALADRCERVAEQITRRARGATIDDRLVSIADPDARPIRKDKLGKPTECGYVEQLCELTKNTRPGARGLILPPATAPGNPGENTLLPTTAGRTLGARALLPRGGARWRLPRSALGGTASPTPAAAALRRRTPGARLAPHPPPPRPLPRWHGGPHQPPQAQLRARALAAEGRPRPAHLDRLGHPHLQPPHARRPRRLTH